MMMIQAAGHFGWPHGPLRVLFLTTSMPVGGAETLLVQLIRGLDRSRFAPELGCLKERGPLGELLSGEVPCHGPLLAHKYDARVLPRLMGLLRRRGIDALVTVGAGDKMFWGRLAARPAGVPVVVSALHSTGWPDPIGRLNRLLTPLTDAFVAVARGHGRHLVEKEGLPAERVRVIPNGVDAARFAPRQVTAQQRRTMGLAASAPTVGIVAALRPEKNHRLFLASARRVLDALPDARFLVVGDGPERPALMRIAHRLGLDGSLQFLGTRSDVAQLLPALDLFTLSSDTEASPVSILEAMACGLPVVATRVGSVGELVSDGRTGYLVPPGDAGALADRMLLLLRDPQRARTMGAAARRQVVAQASLERMVEGYQMLLWELRAAKHRGFSPSCRAIG